MSDQDLDEDDQSENAPLSAEERKLHTQSYDLSVNTLIEWWNDGVLVLPDIQREYVWNRARASRLIESLLLNVPIPVLYFAEAEDKYEIIDGHQRVSSIVRFVDNQFTLVGLKALADAAHSGKRFHELPLADQRRIKTRVIRAIVITEESHPAMKFEVFERLNSGSIALNAQEIRNSTHRGEFLKLVKDLVMDSSYRACLGTKTPRRRMVDNELILRFFAYYYNLDAYKPPLQRFLNEFAERQNGKSEEALADDAALFRRAVSNVHELYGGNAFRLTNQEGELIERNVNRALAETQLVTLAGVSPMELQENKVALRLEFGKLHSDDDFLDNIQRATGDRTRTQGRMRQYREALGRAGVGAGT